MLGKLLKYELPAMGKMLLPLFGAWLITSAFLGLTLRFASDIHILDGLFSFLYVAVGIAAGVMTMISIIQRYRKNLLGDEGYFNLSLPVSTTTHLWSKTISAAIWTCLASLVGICSGYLLAITSGNASIFSIWDLFGSIPAEYRGDAVVILLLACLSVILGSLEGVVKIYAAISMGHMSNRHPNIMAVISYIVFGMVESILLIGGITLMDLLDPDFLHYFDVSGPDELKILLLIVILLTFALAVPYYVISHIILKKKLNLA